jgi:hypothetical protein
MIAKNKGVFIRLTPPEEARLEAFANDKRITLTQALKLAMLSHLDGHGNNKADHSQHDKTRQALSQGIEQAVEYLASEQDKAKADLLARLNDLAQGLNGLGQLLGNGIIAQAQQTQPTTR